MLGSSVGRLAPKLDSLVEDRAGAYEVADADKRVAELGEHRHSSRIGTFEQFGSAVEQVGRRRHVAASQRPPSCECEVLGCPPAELTPGVVDGAELRSEAMRLLGVVAENLLVLADAVGRDALEP